MNPYTVVPPRISQGLKDWQSLLPEPLSGDQPLRTARLMLAAAVLSRLENKNVEVITSYIGPIVGASAGPGTIAVYGFGKEVTICG